MISRVKNNSGVTLIALIVTIIVFMIILGITINYGLSEIHSATNKKTESELGIVQEAVMQRYALVKSANELGIVSSPISSDQTQSSDTNRPSELLGTRLADTATIVNNGFSGISFLNPYSKNEPNMTYEQYYYLLNEEDLKTLGIEKGEDGKTVANETAKGRSYIVNYFTGEIFDIANKKYHKTDTQESSPVYTQPTQIEMSDKTYDFNDN